MRQVGTVGSEEQVARLTDYLLTLGIRIHVDRENERFAIWALDEDRVTQAREELARFVENPADERYAAAQREAERLRDELIQKEKARKKNLVDVRQQWSSPRVRPVTFLLVAISCVVFLFTDFGEHWGQDKLSAQLLIEDPGTRVETSDGKVIERERPGLARAWLEKPDIHRSGFQFWRLITPIFLHAGPIHLLFNMMATNSLGTIIEIRRGSWRLALMVLVIAIVSNVGQYYWSGHPLFGGMSGVAFGLFGYVWIKSEFDPGSGFAIDSRSVSMMLIWLVLCMTGILGSVANAAHFVGLAVGILMGYGPVISRRILGQ